MNCPRCRSRFGAQAEVCSRCGIVLYGRARWSRPRQAFTYRIRRLRILRAIIAAAAFPAVTLAYLRVTSGHSMLDQFLGTGTALAVGAMAYLFLRVDWPPLLLRWRRRRQAHRERRHLRSRLHDLQGQLERSPDDPRLLVAAGEAYLRLGQVQQAREVLGAAQAALPDNDRLRANLVTAWARLGDLQKAYQSYRLLIDRGHREVELLANTFRAARLLNAHEEAVAIGRLWAEADSDSPVARSQLGALLARMGRLDESEAELDRLLREWPDDPDALNNRAVVHYVRGELSSAIANLQRALHPHPDHAEVRSNLGLLLYLDGRPEEAWRCLVDLETWGCAHPHGLRNLGMIYWWNNQIDDATEALRAGLALRPNSVSLHLVLGQLYLDAGAPRAAFQEFQQVVETHHRDPVARTGYGCALYELGRKERAVPEFQASAQLRPSDARVRCNLAVAYMLLNELERAHSELEYAARLSADDANVYFKLGYYFLQSKMYYEACDALRKGIEIDPLSFEAHLNLGIAEYLLTDLPTSAGIFRRATELNPISAQAYHGLALSLALQREWAKAIDAWAHAAFLDRADPDIFYNMGWGCYMHNRFLKAVEALNRSVNIRPGDPDAYNILGLAYARAGMYKDAVYAFKLALEIEPKSAVTYGNMGLAYYLLKEAESAVECWMEVVRLDPEYARRREKVQFTSFDDSLVKPHGFERVSTPGEVHPIALEYLPSPDLVFDAEDWRVIAAERVLEEVSTEARSEVTQVLDVPPDGFPRSAAPE